MELIVISSSRNSETEPELVTRLFEAGLKTFHLRKPKFSTNALKKYLEAIPEHFHNRVVIHTHHNLVFTFNLKGVHFTEDHLSRGFKKWWFLRRLKMKAESIINTRSYKRLSQVYTKENIDFNYYFLGTIFNNLNGEFYSGYYEQGLRAAINTSGKKLVARGGINLKTIKTAYDLGFYGVALNSFLWKSNDPVNKFIGVLQYCRDTNISVD